MGLDDVVVVPHAVVLRSPQLAVYRRLVGGALSQAVEDGALQAAELTGWWEFNENSIDYARVIQRLRETDYSGFFSIE